MRKSLNERLALPLMTLLKLGEEVPLDSFWTRPCLKTFSVAIISELHVGQCREGDLKLR